MGDEAWLVSRLDASMYDYCRPERNSPLPRVLPPCLPPAGHLRPRSGPSLHAVALCVYGQTTTKDIDDQDTDSPRHTATRHSKTHKDTHRNTYIKHRGIYSQTQKHRQARTWHIFCRFAVTVDPRATRSVSRSLASDRMRENKRRLISSLPPDNDPVLNIEQRGPCIFNDRPMHREARGCIRPCPLVVRMVWVFTLSTNLLFCLLPLFSTETHIPKGRTLLMSFYPPCLCRRLSIRPRTHCLLLPIPNMTSQNCILVISDPGFFMIHPSPQKAPHACCAVNL
ncbi:hypothetical protein B0J13DRAFT_192054 [Dactylonectria estremocensis]|uniref:Uncharacterized protein n=1 Tax=Dactylonectria estremocensis TaxID=1079267 RepID=A0A9P9FD72_9HYPO|nr:hypothetical protein B0J13DRAFT_192054 [Dactylonectria estremocensis]